MASDDSFCECEKCEDERTIAAYDVEVAKLRADLAAARAAIKVEREACDEAVRLMAEMSNAPAFKCFRSGVQDDADRIIASNRARRAAEAKGEPK